MVELQVYIGGDERRLLFRHTLRNASLPFQGFHIVSIPIVATKEAVRIQKARNHVACRKHYGNWSDFEGKSFIRL